MSIRHVAYLCRCRELLATPNFGERRQREVRRISQRVEKRYVRIVRCRRIGCGDGFSGGRRAATIAIFFGHPGPKVTSRFKFCPEAIIVLMPNHYPFRSKGAG